MHRGLRRILHVAVRTASVPDGSDRASFACGKHPAVGIQIFRLDIFRVLFGQFFLFHDFLHDGFLEGIQFADFGLDGTARGLVGTFRLREKLCGGFLFVNEFDLARFGVGDILLRGFDFGEDRVVFVDFLDRGGFDHQGAEILLRGLRGGGLLLDRLFDFQLVLLRFFQPFPHDVELRDKRGAFFRDGQESVFQIADAQVFRLKSQKVFDCLFHDAVSSMFPYFLLLVI